MTNQIACTCRQKEKFVFDPSQNYEIFFNVNDEGELVELCDSNAHDYPVWLADLITPIVAP